MPRKKSLLGSVSLRSRRVAASDPASLPSDPVSIERRAIRAWQDEQAKKTLSMQDLIDHARRYPFGMGESVGTGIPGKITFLAPGEVESYTGEDISPYNL